MALLDLSVTTQVLLRLFDLTIHDDWTPSAAAPDFESNDRLLNVHLFHIREEAHRKNFPPPFEGDEVPVRLTPLGLALFYVVTPAVKAEGDDAATISALALERQLVLGQAAKAIHDFPLIDKTTRVGTTLIVDGVDLIEAFGNNRIELILRPAGVDEAVTFWSSGQTQTPPHPSLYVEARVILLQPEEPETFTGLVLSVGNFIFVGFPQLVRSRSTLLVTPPGATQPIPLQASPGRVALFAGTTPAGVSPDNNRLVLEGADLSPRLRLLTLSGPSLRVTINLDDSTDNPDWAPELSGTAIAVHVNRTAIDHSSGDTVLLVPGAYTARIVLVNEAAPPSIQPRTSNPVPLTVIPQLHGLTLAATGVGTRTYTVSVPGGFLDDLDETLVVQFGVAGTVFTKVAMNPGIGQFAYDDTSTIRFTIAEPDPGDLPVQLPVLLVVNEATAMPVWVVVT